MQLPAAVADLAAHAGSRLGTVIKKFVIDDPDVQNAISVVIALGIPRYQRWGSLLREMSSDRRFNSHLWPSELTVDDCARLLHGQEDDHGRAPREVQFAAELIVDRFRAVIGMLRAGDIVVAKYIHNNVVHGSVWSGPTYAVDVRTGDIVAIPDIERWRNGYPETENRLVKECLRLSTPEGLAVILPQKPAAKAIKYDGSKSNNGVKKHCFEWLVGEMEKSPQFRPRLKADYLKEAQTRFKGLSKRSFEALWSAAVNSAGSNWNLPGRPRVKNPRT
jgi:hypothetical protein